MNTNDNMAYITGTFSYFIAKLAPDMTSFAEKLRPVKIIGLQHKDDKPFLHKMNGMYYLSWGCWYGCRLTVCNYPRERGLAREGERARERERDTHRDSWGYWYGCHATATV